MSFGNSSEYESSKVKTEELCRQEVWTTQVQGLDCKGKLAPHYIDPYPISEECGPVAYRLNLPITLASVHNMFHVSQLNKCLKVLVDQEVSEVDQLLPELTYPEHPVRILDVKDRVTRKKTTKV